MRDHKAQMESHLISDPALAASITRTASKQTYYTIRFLVDHGRVDDAYRAYAYFRWVDDWLDQETRPRAERLAFANRQQALMESCFRGDPLTDLTPEECLLADLIRRDTEKNSGLQAYIRNLMAVMAFDADRRGRLVSQRELNEYTHWLAVAVTEALHYFIGHNCASPHGEMRYVAVTGAHITHMLRDAREDAEAGYYNIPREVVAANGIAPWDVESKSYRDWVKESVRNARACFRTGRDYLAQVECVRCRVAGYAYLRRFEVVLDCIEREGYLLRATYPERKGRGRGVEMIGWAVWMALNYRQRPDVSSALPVR
jgi:phytoene/squalene synthetase